MFLSLELFSFLILKSRNYLKFEILKKEIPEPWNFQFHPSVSNSHIDDDFLKNKNAKFSTAKNKVFTEKRYGETNQSFNLLILGGSTSDPLGSRYSGFEGTWPDQLGIILSKNRNFDLTIYNAAVGGATSSQELLRMLLFLQHKLPDLIMSFSGLNEYYFYSNNEYKDFENLYASKMVLKGLNENKLKIDNYYLCKNICFDLRETNSYILLTYIRNKFNDFFPKNNKKDSKIYKNFNRRLSNKNKLSLKRSAQIWRNNILAMNAVAESRNSKYMVFLQPAYGLDLDYEFVKGLYNSDIENKEILSRIDESYLVSFNYMYSFMRKFCNELSFCFDISKEKSLNKNLDLFTDFRHHNKKGNYLIAEILSEFLLEEIKAE